MYSEKKFSSRAEEARSSNFSFHRTLKAELGS
jgi:hypothetical protein